MTALDADVVVVGYGPVGQVLSLLLAGRGHRVLALERWEHPYDLPRATSVDGETARTLAAVGIGEAFTRYGEPADAYEWRNADDKTLLRIGFARRGNYGWPDATTVHQPDLEAALIARGERLPALTVLRGHQVTAVVDRGDHVEVTAGRTFTASWVVGCDGANSVVREGMGVPFADLGFSFDWLLCDVALREPRVFDPANTQFCDPARPRTQVASGPGHRRWEFMRLPGESVEELERAETAWRLLAAFDVTPGNADLLRHHVYRFRAAWAQQWRTGRLLVAGDAAHLMPPFAGQGLCSGVRDVLNLGWKLDLVLRGVCADTLLDTYTAERLPHVRESIDASVALGKVICVTDRREAAVRDASMLANADGTHRPHGPALPLRHGLLHRRLGAFVAAPAGEVIPQGTVVRGTGRGLFDDVIGTGFVVLTTDDPAEVFGPAELNVLGALGAHLVRVGEGFVEDVDGVYRSYLAGAGARCLVVRPDYHVFGAARTSGEAAKLVTALARGLGMIGGWS